MSQGMRKAMISRDRPGPSLSQQCDLLSISRSSFYYAPTGGCEETLTLMRRIDEVKYTLASCSNFRDHLSPKRPFQGGTAGRGSPLEDHANALRLLDFSKVSRSSIPHDKFPGVFLRFSQPT